MHMHIVLGESHTTAAAPPALQVYNNIMAGGAHKLAVFLQHLRRCSSAALDGAMSLVCSVSKAYAQHQVTDRVARSRRTLRCTAGQAWRRLLSCSSLLLLHVLYFAAVSCAGWGLLAALTVRASNRTPRGIDMFFTAVSAATVSSMSTVEMEVFSSGQLLVLTALMLAGGEVFLSLLGLASKWSQLRRQIVNRSRRVESHADADDIELETTTGSDDADAENNDAENENVPAVDTKIQRRNAVRALFYVVLAILAAAHVLGAVAVAAYVSAAPGARRTLRRKSLGVWTFAAFTAVSTFSNCGFLPTNENMMAFTRDVPLQLLLVPMALAGNTMFPPLLAACVRAAAAATRRPELVDLAAAGKKGTGSGYQHLLPARRCWMLAGTVAAFVAVQAAMVCALEWGGALRGLSAGEKVSNALFLAVNSRHAGESTLDISTLATAILVLFVLMMYLPPYTTWFPFEENSKRDHSTESQGTRLLKSTILSQLSYLTIFVIAICITERRKLKEDPLNFNVLSIVVEVVSAYGNVGFSMGYSCSRQLNPDGLCTDRWTGFVGRWSDSGKLILIVVMFFGRLKKFSMKGGKSWKLT